MITEVREWLEHLGLDQYADAFEENDVDFRALVHLTDSDLKELGLSLGHRRVVLAAIEKLSADQTEDGTLRAVIGQAANAEAERRQITFLFCDLVGSTELSRMIDPEELRDVLQSFQNAVTSAIRRYDGYVAKFLGDGILAYFGWPRAHEHQAERAVRAGLSAINAIARQNAERETALQVRVGIDTGHVVIGDLVGDSVSDTEAAIGESPNLAARLQSVALPGQVYIGDSTRVLLGEAFVLEDAGKKELKGFADPVQAWNVLREAVAETRFKASRGGALTRRAGRDHELELLRERWKTAAGGRGQVILLSGEAGIGKSRIVQDLRDAIGPASCNSLYFQCSPHRTNSAFHPIIQHLRLAAGFSVDDDSGGRLDKLETLIRHNGDDVRSVAPVFAALLSLPGADRYGELDLPPQQLRNRTIDLVIAQVLREAEDLPLLCVVEDAHWMDPSMIEFVEAMIDRIAGRPVCVLITYRPEFIPPWSARSHMSAIALNRLGREQSVEIVQSVAGPELVAAIVDQIVARSDGVPLYVEELTKSVLESLITESENAIDHIIPASLQSSLIARLDRLGRAKEVAQVGAVFGREFPYNLMKLALAKSDTEMTADLERLIDSELVVVDGEPPDATYTFKHSLVQDAAYSTILLRRRKQLHARIVEIMEQQMGSQVAERVDTLAHHSYLGELWDKAFAYHLAAGLRAMNRSALREAAAQFEQALAASARMPKSRETHEKAIDTRFELRNALWALGRFEDILTRLSEAQRLADTLKDDVRTGWISVFRSASQWQLGRAREALKSAEHALKTSRAADDLSLRVASNFYLGCVRVTTGDCRKAEPYFEAVAEMLSGELSKERCGLPFAPAVISRSWLVWALAERGEFEPGMTLAREAVEIAEDIGNPFNLAHIYYDLGYFHEIRGEITEAVDALEKANALVEEWSLKYLSPFIMGFLGHAYALAGRNAESLDYLRRARAAYEDIGLGLFRSLVGIQFGEALLIDGQVDHALIATTDSVLLAQQRGERGHQAYGLRILGDILSHPDHDDPEGAVSHYKKALSLATRLGMHPLAGQCHLALSSAYAGNGRSADAGKHRDNANRIATDLGMSYPRQQFPEGQIHPDPD